MRYGKQGLPHRIHYSPPSMRKIYRNGDREIKLPLKLLIAASNELPAHGEGLEALWDRFLLRIICTCVKDEATFLQHAAR